MRKILFVLFLIGIGFVAKSQQTNPFPTTDSLERFINRYIRNSPVEAFQNLRMNTALIGMLRFIQNSEIGSGIDTAYTVNDSTFRLINFVPDTFDIVLHQWVDAAANVGAGVGIFKNRSSDTLYFKSLTEGYGINIASNTNDLNISTDTGQLATPYDLSLKLDSVTIKTAVDPDPDTLYQWKAGSRSLVGLIPKGGGASGDTTQVEKPFIVKAGTAGDPDTLAFSRGIGIGIDTDSNAIVNWVPEYSTVTNYSTNNKRSDAASTIVLSNGRTWTWYTGYGSPTGDNDSAVIVGKYSDDGGRTWEGLDTAVQNTSNGSYIPSVYFNPTQDTLRMLYFRQNASNTAQIYMTYSVDFMADNPTWSTPTLAFGSGLHYMSPAADRVFVNKAGTYFYPLPIHIAGILASSAGRYDGYLLRSTDGGANWDTIPGVRLISPDTLCVEGGLYQTDDANHLMTYYFRTRSGQVYYAQSTTSSGTVWGAVYPTTLYAPNSTTTIKYLEKYKTLVAVHNQYEGAGNVNGNVGRRRMVMSVKHLQPINANGLLPVDGVGGGWQQVYEIDSATNFQFIEPTLTFTGNNILVTYSKGDYAVGDTFSLKAAIIPYYFIHGTDSRYTSDLVLEKTFNSTDPNWIEFYITGLNKTNDYFKLQNQSSGSQFGHKPWFRLRTTSVQNPQFRFDVDMPTSTNAAPAYYFNQITNAGQYSIGGTASSFKIANNDVVHHEIQSNGILHIRKISDGSSSELLKMYLPAIGEANGYTYIKNVTGGTGAYATWLDVKAFNSQYGLYITPHSAAGNGSVWIDPDNGSGADVSSSNTLLRVTNFGTSSNDERFRLYGDGSLRLNNQTGEMMRLDATTASLGIGTAGPDARLDVLDATNPQIRMTQADGTVYGQWRVNSSGDVSYTGSNTSPFLALGGTTSSFAGFLRDGASIAVRVGDNSAYAHLKVLDEAYNATNWDGDITVPTKNAIRDALQSIGAITSINSQTGPAITLATGTANTDFTISQSSNTITFDIPSASAANRGLVTISAQTFGGRKTMNDGLVVVGSGGAVPRFSLAGSLTMNVASDPNAMNGAAISVAPFTFNDGGSARTVSNNQGINYMGVTTLTATNAVNYENIATLYIAGEPNPSTNMTALKTRSLRAEGISHTNIMGHSVNESSSSTVVMARIGIYIFTGTTSTYTLPDLAQFQGAVYYVKNAGSGDQTVTRSGTDNIYDTSSATSIVIPAGESRIIVAGTSFWYVIRG